MSRCAKDKINQDREESCIESITGGDIHQQSKGQTCKDRGPGKVKCVLQAEASSALAPGLAGCQDTHFPKVPCSTATSPVLMPEMMSFRTHSLKRYAGSQEMTGNKPKANFLALCGEQLQRHKGTKFCQ